MFDLRLRNRKSKIENRKFDSGFTIIELLVSMSILMLLMGISFANFGKADQNELLRYGARRLADSLQSIQSFAQSGTLAQYPTAQSYGVHTDTPSQRIALFADQNTSTGIGRWDGDTADGAGKKDALMREALAYTTPGKGEVKLEKITVYRSPDDAAPLEVTSIDVAAVRPNARLVMPGLVDGEGHDVTIIHRVVFTILQTRTGKRTDVVIYPLSGRIDVDY